MTSRTETDSDSKCGVDTVNTERKTLVYVRCHDCDGVDETVIVDDSQESSQAQEVAETYSSTRERHSDATSHRIQMGITEGSEIDLVHIARAIASWDPTSPVGDAGNSSSVT
jgi:hypothetical protein